MMFYAVIDTNVLVSALLNINSNPGIVLCSVFNGQTTPLINTDILAEYREVLARKKFHFPKETVDIILKRLENSSLKTEEIPAEFPEVSDPKDRCFFAVTMAARQTEEALLITGNIRHFPQQPFVVTPAQFVEMLHNRA
ncbi:MAG TPA: putative toxin-antitoxin system toxin component, PIN family [Lentisphaeria bacterium]|nr:putative toxin-antitoxin system toxin component, PIN family [Lentisphaeria bacterium]